MPEDENMKLLLMSGTISGLMKRFVPYNEIVRNDDSRQEVSEWFAGFLTTQIKNTVAQTREAMKESARFTELELLIISQGLFLFVEDEKRKNPDCVNGDQLTGKLLDLSKKIQAIIHKVSYE